MMYEERDRDFVCTLLGLQIGNANQRPVRGPAIGEVQALLARVANSERKCKNYISKRKGI